MFIMENMNILNVSSEFLMFRNGFVLKPFHIALAKPAFFFTYDIIQNILYALLKFIQ